jgi:hypothetical protein
MKIKRRPTIETDQTHKRQRSLPIGNLSDADLCSFLSSTSDMEGTVDLVDALFSESFWDHVDGNRHSEESLSPKTHDPRLVLALDNSSTGTHDSSWQQCLSDSNTTTSFYESDSPEALLLDALYSSPTSMVNSLITTCSDPVVTAHQSQTSVAANYHMAGHQVEPPSPPCTPSQATSRNSRAPLANAYELLCPQATTILPKEGVGGAHGSTCSQDTV